MCPMPSRSAQNARASRAVNITTEERDLIIAWQLEDATLDEVAHYFVYHADQMAEQELGNG